MLAVISGAQSLLPLVGVQEGRTCATTCSQPASQLLPRAGCSCAHCRLPKALIPSMPSRQGPTSCHLRLEEKLVPNYVLSLLQAHPCHCLSQALPNADWLLPRTLPLEKQIIQNRLQTKRRNKKKGQKSYFCQGLEESPNHYMLGKNSPMGEAS